MDDDRPEPTAIDERSAARRKFLKTAGQVAVTTPAVTLLLSAGTRSASAGDMVVSGPLDGSEIPTFDESQDGNDGVCLQSDDVDPGSADYFCPEV
jgi:hypothetical protein